MLKETPSECVATYIRMGIETRPKLSVPEPIERAAMQPRKPHPRPLSNTPRRSVLAGRWKTAHAQFSSEPCYFCSLHFDGDGEDAVGRRLADDVMARRLGRARDVAGAVGVVEHE